MSDVDDCLFDENELEWAPEGVRGRREWIMRVLEEMGFFVEGQNREVR